MSQSRVASTSVVPGDAHQFSLLFGGAYPVSYGSENAFAESFIGRLRDECLNEHWFITLKEAREHIEAWRQDYNEVRPS